MGRDMECTFGILILKGQWRVLKAGVCLHGMTAFLSGNLVVFHFVGIDFGRPLEKGEFLHSSSLLAAQTLRGLNAG